MNYFLTLFLFLYFLNLFLHCRTVHLYLSQRFGPLKVLMDYEFEYSMFDPMGRNTNMGSNLWLIYIPSESLRKDAIDVYRNSKLRLDSLVFEFYRDYNGNTKDLLRNYEHENEFTRSSKI